MSTHDESIESICECCGETVIAHAAVHQCPDCARVQDHLGDWRFDHLLRIMKHQAKLTMKEQFESLHADLERIRKNREADGQ